MSDIRQLRKVDGAGPVNPAVIEILEKALVNAKAGQLQFVLLVTVDHDAAVTHGWSGGAKQRIPHRAILGAIEHAKFEWYVAAVRPK